MEIKRSKEEAVRCRYLIECYLRRKIESAGHCGLACINEQRLNAIRRICLAGIEQEFGAELSRSMQYDKEEKIENIKEAFGDRMKIDNIIICQCCGFWKDEKKPKEPKHSPCMSSDHA